MYYAIASENGTELANGVQDYDVACRYAQEFADELDQTVELYRADAEANEARREADESGEADPYPSEEFEPS